MEIHVNMCKYLDLYALAVLRQSMMALVQRCNSDSHTDQCLIHSFRLCKKSFYTK